MMWRKRFAHAPMKKIKDSFIYAMDDCKSTTEDCEICPLARHIRISFTNSDTRSNKSFALLRLDV